MARPNILLIILDSVRARNTSLHGHPRTTTPSIESLAREATVYEQARSPSITSFESHASIFTGLYPSEHGMRTYDDRLRPDATIWAELRDDHGYETAVFSANGFATGEEYGIASGFDTVVTGGQLLDDLPFPDGLDPRSHYHTGIDALTRIKDHGRPFGSLANHLLVRNGDRIPFSLDIERGERIYETQFVDWYRSQSGPWAACLNFQDAHTAYLGDAPSYDEWGGPELRGLYDDVGHDLIEFTRGDHPWWLSEAYEHLYDGCIRKADARVGRLVDSLREAGTLEETLVVVTSDHGEAFGEYSRVRPDVRLAGHGPGVHEVKVHVPLVVKLPGQTAGRRVDAPASLVRFPSVVRASVEGERRTDGFVPERPVLVESNGFETRHADEEIVGPLERLTGHARAVYEESDDSLVKCVTWGDDDCTVAVRDAQVSYRMSDDGATAVESAFRTLDDAGVTVARGDALSEATEERLRNFGYIE
jgi:arylsulfatase A-like enzyme